MEGTALIKIINEQMDLNLPAQTVFADMRLHLQEAVRQLITADFQQLVHVLYRVDVNERKLKYLLQENVGEDAAVIIADLIIERQREKMASRSAYNQPDEHTESDEERW